MAESPLPDPPTQSTSANLLPTGAQFKPKPTTTTRTFLSEFWSHVTSYAEEYDADFKDCQIPLARIKKLMKTDPEINMIATEVSVLLDKACEIFINDITVRAFLIASASNRHTVLKEDVAAAISKSEMFDFLIDIVPGQEEPTPDEVPASPTSPASTYVPLPPKPSKKRIKASAPSSPIQPDPKPKKRKGLPGMSTKLRPEEVAVVIPEAELRCFEAPPISDCELAAPAWELAVPISWNSQGPLSSLEEEEKPEIGAPGDWELAVPIDQADSMEPPPRSPSWEIAVPISRPADPSAPHHSPSAGRTWDLAVPITQTSHPTDSPRQKPAWEQAVPISASDSNDAHPRHPKGWELAVPISGEDKKRANSAALLSRRPRCERGVPIEQTPSPVPSSPSQRASRHLRLVSGSSSRELLIDPALRNMSSENHRGLGNARPSAPHVARLSLSDIQTEQLDHTTVIVKEEGSI